MRDRTVIIKTSDGGMESFVTHPESEGPFCAVVLYIDAPGIREELYDLARRLGTVGHYCEVPDLYYRHGRVRLGPGHREDPAQMALRTRCRESLSNAMVMEDTQALGCRFILPSSYYDAMSSIRKTISLPPAVAERLDKEAKRRKTSVSALVTELVQKQPEPLPYAALIEDDEDLSERVEEILARLAR